jgi:hypothetical protein
LSTKTTVIYDGPHDAVEVPAADLVAERGKPVDVPTGIADALLQQDCWKAPKAPATTQKQKGDN